MDRKRKRVDAKLTLSVRLSPEVVEWLTRESRRRFMASANGVATAILTEQCMVNSQKESAA